jgi:hypothetical protein
MPSERTRGLTSWYAGPGSSVATSGPRPVRHWTRLWRTAAFFGVGLVISLGLFESVAARRIAAAGGANVIGGEVAELRRITAQPDARVERVYVGDSVARQFFPPGQEPGPAMRFLTSNATISLAGNYYLLEDAFRAWPNARDIVLLARPEMLQVNLDPPFTADYFSGYFHSPAEIAELWRVKQDPQLTWSMISRFVLPATLAVNSAWRRQPQGFTAVVPGFSRTSVAEVRAVTLSVVAEHFLARMRTLAATRGGTVRVVPVPMPDDQPWEDPQQIFSDPIMYLGREAFVDAIHLGQMGGTSVHWCVGSAISRRFAERFGLTSDLPTQSFRLHDVCEDPARPFRVVR